MNEHDVSEPRESDDAFARRFHQAYEQTPRVGPDASSAVVRAVREAPTPRRGLGMFDAWLEPRTVTVRPIVAAACALALLVVGGLLQIRLVRLVQRGAAPENAAAIAAAPGEAVRFVLVAPGSKVALVGDFNSWDVAATPMRRDTNGVWTVTVRLEPGWHAYAFVVDGSKWVHDPHAPLAPADDYGVRRSVVVVGGQGA